MHARSFLKQGGRRQDTVRRAFPNSLDIDTNQPRMSQFCLTPLLPHSTSSPPSRKLEPRFLWNVIHPISSHRVSEVRVFFGNVQKKSTDSLNIATSQEKHLLNGIKWKVTKLDAVLVSKARPALIQVKYYLYQTETRCFKITISSSGIILAIASPNDNILRLFFSLVFWEVFQTSNF